MNTRLLQLDTRPKNYVTAVTRGNCYNVHWCHNLGEGVSLAILNEDLPLNTGKTYTTHVVRTCILLRNQCWF